MHSTDPALTVLGSFLPIPATILLFLFNGQTLLLLFTVISAHPSPILLIVCIPQILLLLIKVISAHHSSIMLLFALQRPCSYCLESFVRIPAPFCFFFHNLEALFLLFRIIIANPGSILFFLFNVQTLLLLFRVISAHPSPILLIVCIPQIVLLRVLHSFLHSKELALTL